MDYFAGLDVSVKETSVCVVDSAGRIVREVKVASEPDALLAVLKTASYHFKRIGLEAGPLSQWLYSALAEAGLSVICVETRHMRAVLKAQINKTDRNDARGIAQMMRVGLYRLVHVKTLRSQKLRMLLTHRKLLQSKAIAIDNDLRGTLRNFGLKVGVVGAAKFEVRIKELVENLPDLATLVEPLLIVRRVLREQIGILHRRLLAIVRDDEVCRRSLLLRRKPYPGIPFHSHTSSSGKIRRCCVDRLNSPPKADTNAASRRVRSGPIADILSRSLSRSSDRSNDRASGLRTALVLPMTEGALLRLEEGLRAPAWWVAAPATQ